MTPPNPPKTDAERQALRRQRRKEEVENLRDALKRIAAFSTDAKARAIAMEVLLLPQEDYVRTLPLEFLPPKS